MSISPSATQEAREELRRAALEYHQFPTPGKVAIQATKQLVNQHDLALAYSPGVAAPCEEIVKDPNAAYKYTSRGNLVAVISNGTAVLGLGMIGVGYGFISGVTAGGIGLYWPAADYGRIAGRTYIAWCLAAISLPVLAGHLFDLTRQYETAVLIAAAANVTGLALALTLPRKGWKQ